MEPWPDRAYGVRWRNRFVRCPVSPGKREAAKHGEGGVTTPHDGNGNGRMDGIGVRPAQRRVEVIFTEEQYAALEGWRSANRVVERSEAVRELVRLGLLAEIARVYRLVAGAVEQDDGPDRDFDTRG
jgi:hypothetical protein